jgi:hypothetical protein
VREVDVRAEGLERDATLLDLLLAAHLCAAEAARDHDAHALDLADGDDLLDRLLEHAAERHALLKALGDHVGDDRGVSLRLADLDDIELERAAISGATFGRRAPSSLRSLVAFSPERPITRPGRAVWTMTRSSLAERSISTFEV